ncbi:cupin domain-containing protein [Antiquaquibacter soli]|uniref:Cupin domain-containing protein n=1 Tax=Antiquaquibacter soli TaxID=3064523 RepID=A0ABT9BT94_9MICO|nr:cupin domain-containing protein [Protaetiibacter sp. WY-16]MDO7883643.1 cupin domain-containing protein [Protaetiibacter sp. WY-16]
MTTEHSIRLHSAQPTPYTWEGVDVLEYKEEDGTFKAVTRQVLTDAEHGQGASLRYFEVGPGGHTTLEHHEHTHVVVPIRGRGRALVGTQVVDLAQHDVVFVPSWTWHQFQSVGDEPFGFLCSVTVERDRPVRPTAEQIAELESYPGVGGFIKY